MKGTHPMPTGIYDHIKMRGRNHFAWKGEKASYSAIHIWLKNNFGAPNRCENENCTTVNPYRYEWALLKGRNYSRERKDYRTLCINCHRKYDAIVPKNKGIRKVHIKLCEWCQKGFYPNRRVQQFCSNRCSGKWRYINLPTTRQSLNNK